tara:strand:- start:445 stop:792 length:348 start_codon:yes stop_codon:yes gene_type:complete
MKLFIVILLITSLLFPKEYCYSESEIKEIQEIIEECDFKEQLHIKVEETLSGQVKNCEQLVASNELIIRELEKQLELKDDLIKEIKPKWHENKYLWFGYGIVAIILPTWVLGNVN